MALTRRLFARAMAAAPVAAQALARMGAGNPVLHHKGLMDMAPDASQPDPVAGCVSGPGPGWLKSRIADLQDAMKQGLSEEEEERCMLLARASLDPDLASLRSFSASARVQLQYQRNREQLLKRNKNWMTHQIAKMTEELAKA